MKSLWMLSEHRRLEVQKTLDTLTQTSDYVNYPSSPSPVVDYFLFVRYPFAPAGKRWNSLQTRLASSSI